MKNISFVLKIKADFLRALSHPARLRILQALENEERSIGNLVKQIEIEPANLYRHIFILKKAGILGSLSRGKKVFYFVKNEEVFDILSSVSQVLKKNITVDAQFMKALES